MHNLYTLGSRPWPQRVAIRFLLVREKVAKHKQQGDSDSAKRFVAVSSLTGTCTFCHGCLGSEAQRQRINPKSLATRLYHLSVQHVWTQGQSVRLVNQSASGSGESVARAAAPPSSPGAQLQDSWIVERPPKPPIMHWNQSKPPQIHRCPTCGPWSGLSKLRQTAELNSYYSYWSVKLRLSVIKQAIYVEVLGIFKRSSLQYLIQCLMSSDYCN